MSHAALAQCYTVFFKRTVEHVLVPTPTPTREEKKKKNTYRLPNLKEGGINAFSAFVSPFRCVFV